MGNMTLFIVGIAMLSLGTYLMRLGGAKLGSRLAFSERSQALLSDAATVLLFSVALATTFYEGEHFAGMARVLGVAFCGISRLAQDAADRGDRCRRSGNRAVTNGGHTLKAPAGALCYLCRNPTDNRLDIRWLLLIYREHRSQAHRFRSFCQ
ncbi:Branched-chain amino acid transport protein (AzlD) [Citrobacter freundii]|nr:Branched-chain amino acid transport protein (AzlD) [Citrobacter freundii]